MEEGRLPEIRPTTDVTSYQRRQQSSLTKRRGELAGMQDRLLNAYIAGSVDEGTFQAKGDDLKAQIATVDESLASVEDIDEACAETALQLFDWSQQAADLWRGSHNAVRREILDAVCLNRTLSDVSLVTEKRKPFDVLAKRPDLKKSRGDWRSFERVVEEYASSCFGNGSTICRGSGALIAVG